ncbi:hypothetical protein Bca52824_090733 [Brassica carinata]|uniref:Neprosin PEP catalytic domain-containing protein n=1 Tax=Brassica carinata TaxID=52824 RepID=A0A8X7NVS8_BRACI|nr:hypothetical protein Bca52824_090733 [Brassica carinata]
MASFNNFLLLVLLTFTLILVTEAAQERRRAIPSEAEKKQLERQLKAINKPAIKSFKTKQGDIFDCINVHKQVAFDHHLLRNHSVQLKPKNVPEWITSNNISWEADPLQYLQEEINCPDGTVIVKRTTMQDLMHAQRLKSIGFSGPRNFLTERNNTDVTGPHYFSSLVFLAILYVNVRLQRLTLDLAILWSKGHLNLWDPQVSQDQFSGAFMAVAGGPKERLSSILLGGCPSLYEISQDHVHLYTYWGKDNDKFGCYDITCPGFVQVSKTIPLGALLQPVSVYNGTQYEIRILPMEIGGLHITMRTLDTGLRHCSWTRALIKEQIMQLGRSSVQSSDGEGSSYGKWALSWEGLSKAAYVNSIKVITGFKKVIDPEINRLKARETSSRCYRTLYGNGGEASDPKSVKADDLSGRTEKVVNSRVKNIHISPQRVDRRETKRDEKLSAIACESFSTVARLLRISLASTATAPSFRRSFDSIQIPPPSVNLHTPENPHPYSRWLIPVATRRL